MIYLYRFFYSITKFFVQIFNFLLPEFLKKWVSRRNVDFNLLVPLRTKSIWFHAASGEIEYVKNIITEIKKSNPNQKIVLTYSSPSIEKLLHNMIDRIDLIIPLPWDQPAPIKKLISIINPQTLVFAKTDFWPELLYQARKVGVRCGVVSFALNLKPAPSFSQKWVLKNLQFIFVSDESTTERLKTAGINSIVAADTRFDQVFYRLGQPSKFNFTFIKPLITFGSTWPEDDQVLLKVVPDLLKNGFQIVWCPHDVSTDSLQKLKNKLTDFNSVAYSALTGQKEIKNDILIIDQVGLLADLYRQSSLAFIGGSFKEKIHSVMEALCAGNIVFFGPFFQNNTEAIEFSELKLAFPVTTADQLLEKILGINANSKSEMQEKLRTLTSRKKGSSKKIAEFLLT